jgi:outer membrane protein OmpU
MRDRLLGSSMLAALGSVLGAGAAADDGIKLELGGSYQGAAGVALSEDFSRSSTVDRGNLRSYVFKQDVEIHFSGETTLDNGLAVGAYLELEGQTDAEDQIDKVYAYFKGSFGEIRFGDLEEGYAQLCNLVPSASELFGADSPNFNFSNAGIAGYAATNGTCYGLDDNATKVVYFSPSFGGFQFAASFAPDNTEDTRNTLDGAGTRLTNDEGQNSENLSLAVTFQRDFDDINVTAGGGTTQSFQKEVNPNNVDRARAYNAYLHVEFADFAIGAASELRQNFGTTSADQWVFGAGATYDVNDELTIGFGWTRGDYEKAVGANGVGPFNATHDVYSLTASYELTDGISVDGVIEFSDYRSRDDAGPDYRGIAAGLGTNIDF